MDTKRMLSRRIINLLLVIPGWLMMTSSAASFALGDLLLGVIAAAIALVLAMTLASGRFARRLEGRPVPAAAFVILGLILVVVLYQGVQNLRFNELVVSGEVHVPGVIFLLGAIGSFILTVALILETIRLLRSEA